VSPPTPLPRSVPSTERVKTNASHEVTIKAVAGTPQRLENAAGDEIQPSLPRGRDNEARDQKGKSFSHVTLPGERIDQDPDTVSTAWLNLRKRNSKTPFALLPLTIEPSAD
jgi:hypothetical protein